MIHIFSWKRQKTEKIRFAFQSRNNNWWKIYIKYLW